MKFVELESERLIYRKFRHAPPVYFVFKEEEQ